MEESTKAIVLKSIKYGDTSLIVKCYTEQAGIVTYILRGVLKNKKGKLKAAYFQPLMQLDLVVSRSKKGKLQNLKEARVGYTYESIYVDYYKQCIAYFIAEMLANTIQEEEGNPALYAYIETSLRWLDLHEKISNFHLVFLVNLTKFLGFYPKQTDQFDDSFDMVNGVFTTGAFVGKSLVNEDLILFSNILGIKFDNIETISLNVIARQRLLEIIVEYYELHLIGFQKPKSIQVLKKLFN